MTRTGKGGFQREATPSVGDWLTHDVNIVTRKRALETMIAKRAVLVTLITRSVAQSSIAMIANGVRAKTVQDFVLIRFRAEPWRKAIAIRNGDTGKAKDGDSHFSKRSSMAR